MQLNKRRAQLQAAAAGGSGGGGEIKQKHMTTRGGGVSGKTPMRMDDNNNIARFCMLVCTGFWSLCDVTCA